MPATIYTPAQLADLRLLEHCLGFDLSAIGDMTEACDRLAQTGLSEAGGARRLLRQIACLWREVADELEPVLVDAASQQPEECEPPF